MTFMFKMLNVAILIIIAIQWSHAQTDGEPKLILNPDTADEFVITIDETSPVGINPGTRDVTVFTADPQACAGTDSGNCPSATVEVGSFTPNPASIEQGASFTATLGSLGATECRRTGLPETSWNTAFISPPPDANRTQTVPSDIAAGTYTLAYECANGDFTGRQTATLEIVEADSGEDPVPATCDDVPLPSGWSRDTTAIAKSNESTRTWSDAFRGATFPATQGENIAVNQKQFAAFSFDPSTAPAGASGELTFGDLGNSVSSGIGVVAPTISMSQCPGDFRPELGDCRLMLSKPFKWTTDPNDTSGACILPDADRLFLNITYIAEINLDDPSGFLWNCRDESECGHFVQ